MDPRIRSTNGRGPMEGPPKRQVCGQRESAWLKASAAIAHATVIEAEWLEAKTEGCPYPNWCCVECSLQLRDELQERVPQLGAVAIKGEFELPDRRPVNVFHAWVALECGAILDLTAGQFIGGRPLAVALPGDPLYSRYHEKARLADDYHSPGLTLSPYRGCRCRHCRRSGSSGCTPSATAEPDDIYPLGAANQRRGADDRR